LLTKKQHQLLFFIDQYQKQKGYSPSFEEMKEALSLKSKSGIYALVVELVERGFCRRLENKARAIEIIKLPSPGDHEETSLRIPIKENNDPQFLAEILVGRKETLSCISLPLYGEIAAGIPIEAFYNEADRVEIPLEMIGPHGAVDVNLYFALKIAGDSMKEAGILHGDIVILKRCMHAPAGSIVAALVDEEEVTLKRLQFSEEFVVLEPANRDCIPQIYEKNRVRIQGTLVNLIRKY
jgi:repressor LexA